MKIIKILAHRGYLVNGEPENSIPAFLTAIHYGADGIEFDVLLTSDKRFVCFHDYTLRKIGRSDALKDLTHKELTSIEISEGIMIPSLEEILELFGNKIILNIELKNATKETRKLVELIRQYSLNPKKIIVSSFHHTPLRTIKEIDPDIQTGLLFHSPINQLRIAKDLNCDAIHPFYDLITEEWVRFRSLYLTKILRDFSVNRGIKKAQKLGLLVNPWTVNHDKYLKAAFKRQVDNVITDEVEKALKIRNQLFR
ncbi:MAG: glycerophosphodiester phosphodiesterase [Promethearchaeota archaeon]